MSEVMTTEPLLRVTDLKKNFSVRGGLLSREVGRVHAVDGVSFEVQPGETLGLVGADLRAMRRNMQIVLQDPFAALNPRMTVGAILGEAFTIHQFGSSGSDREQRVANLLVMAGLKAHAPLSA